MSRAERPSRTESASEMGSARRGLGFDLAPGAESIQFGCSMLSRVRLRLDSPNALAPMRCSLGYALHSDEEVERCMGVEGPADCWKTSQSWRVPTDEPAASRPQSVKTAKAARAASAESAGTVDKGTVVAAVIIEKSAEVRGFVKVVALPEPGSTD